MKDFQDRQKDLFKTIYNQYTDSHEVLDTS